MKGNISFRLAQASNFENIYDIDQALHFYQCNDSDISDNNYNNMIYNNINILNYIKWTKTIDTQYQLEYLGYSNYYFDSINYANTILFSLGYPDKNPEQYPNNKIFCFISKNLAVRYLCQAQKYFQQGKYKEMKQILNTPTLTLEPEKIVFQFYEGYYHWCEKTDFTAANQIFDAIMRELEYHIYRDNILFDKALEATYNIQSQKTCEQFRAEQD